MGESPLTWPSLQLPWLSLYLRAEAQAGSYAMIDQASTYRQGARMGTDTRYFFTLLPASCYYLYIFKGEVIFYQNRTLYFTVLGKGC